MYLKPTTKFPFVSKVDPDLSSYVTQKAINGIFYYVAQEEILIRKDPAAQVTASAEKSIWRKILIIVIPVIGIICRQSGKSLLKSTTKY